MATNHTENYQLNLWEPGDSFLRTEFNENFQKLDAAIFACHSVAGTYKALGTEAVEIHLGFRPKLVMLSGSRDYGFGFVMGDRCSVAYNDGNWGRASLSDVTLTDDGFRVAQNAHLFNRDAGDTVTYVAFH